MLELCVRSWKSLKVQASLFSFYGHALCFASWWFQTRLKMSFLLRTLATRNVCRSRVQLTEVYRNLRTANKSPLLNATRSPVKVNFQRLLSSNAHDHSKLWVLEKAVSLGLLAVIPAAFTCQNSLLDYALALSLVAHVHWGIEAIVVDYIRPAIFGAVIPKAAIGSVYLLSIIALAGLFYLNYSDVGLSTAIRMIAKV